MIEWSDRGEGWGEERGRRGKGVVTCRCIVGSFADKGSFQ